MFSPQEAKHLTIIIIIFFLNLLSLLKQSSCNNNNYNNKINLKVFYWSIAAKAFNASCLSWLKWASWGKHTRWLVWVKQTSWSVSYYALNLKTPNSNCQIQVCVKGRLHEENPRRGVIVKQVKFKDSPNYIEDNRGTGIPSLWI